jgi:hypothetical protein
MKKTGVGLLVIATAMACGSSSSSGGETTPPPGDDGGTDAPAPTGKMTVLVIAPPLDGTFPDPIPVAGGASVIVDLPGGEHRELTAGADGRLTIEGIDWSKGTASLAAHGLSKAPYALTDVGPESFAKIPNSGIGAPADAVLYLFPYNKDSFPITATFSVLNKTIGANDVIVGATTGQQIGETSKTDVQLHLRDGKPFTVVTRQCTFAKNGRALTITGSKWASFEQAAAANNAQISLDLGAGTPLTPTTINAHITIPGGNAGPLGGASQPILFASTIESVGLLVGLVGNVAPNADGSAFDVALETVTVAGYSPQTFFGVAAADGSFSDISIEGFPTEGQTLGAELKLPPTTPSGTISLAAPVAIAGGDDVSVVRLVVSNLAQDYQLVVDAPPGTKSLHIPKLPAAAKPTGADISGQIYLLSNNDSAKRFYRNLAASGQFTVKF